MYRNMVKWGGVKIEKNTPPKYKNAPRGKSQKCGHCRSCQTTWQNTPPFRGTLLTGCKMGEGEVDAAQEWAYMQSCVRWFAGDNPESQHLQKKPDVYRLATLWWLILRAALPDSPRPGHKAKSERTPRCKRFEARYTLGTKMCMRLAHKAQRMCVAVVTVSISVKFR